MLHWLLVSIPFYVLDLHPGNLIRTIFHSSMLIYSGHTVLASCVLLLHSSHKKPSVSNQNSNLWQKGVNVDWKFSSIIFTLVLSRLRLIPTTSIKWLQSQHQYCWLLLALMCISASVSVCCCTWVWRGLHARTGLQFTTMSLIILSDSQQQQTKQWDEQRNQIAKEDHVFIYMPSFLLPAEVVSPMWLSKLCKLPQV